MKKLIYLTILCGCTLANAQSWVWGKRGGGSGNTVETIQSMATDSQKNIYATAMVSAINIDVDGHALNSTDMGQAINPTDAVLTSFACDGSYRWSKIFTGQDREELKYVQTDAQDNVYVTGFTFGGGGNNSFFKYPNYLDTDVTFPQTTTNPDYFISFIVKYNSNGVMQWIKRIGAQFSGQLIDNYISIAGMTVDSAGNSYTLTLLTPGNTYCDGNLTVTGNNQKYYVIKHDSNGNYTGATYLDFQSTYGSGITFYRNPYNGNYYLTASKGSVNDTATFGGQNATHDTVLACFDSTGQFQWMREDATNRGSMVCPILDITFDTNNDVYLALILAGSNNGQNAQDSFLGYSIVENTFPVTVMKTNTNVDTLLWASRSNFTIGSNVFGGIFLNTNEVAISNYSWNGFTWGTQTSVATPGATPLLARLNKTTGECIGLSNINNNNQLNDNGDILVADVSGDYIMGGPFHSMLYFDNNQQILNNGPETDFFIAKYATQACSPLAINETVQPKVQLQVYPNPTSGKVYFDNSLTQYKSVVVYNPVGQQVMTIPLTTISNSVIDLSQMSKGVYMLQFTCEKGSETVKVEKK